MSNLLSKKKLFESLARLTGDKTYISEGLKHKSISNETYGPKSCVYVHVKSELQVNPLRALLRADGHKVSGSYFLGGATLEVHTSYFKGDRWWE